MGRRNLNAFTRGELALVKKDALAALARERMLAGINQYSPVPNLGQATERTEDSIATLAGISGETVRKVEKVLKDAPEAVIQAARSGSISTHDAYATTKSLAELEPEERAKIADKVLGTRSNDRPITQAVKELAAVALRKKRRESLVQLRVARTPGLIAERKFKLYCAT